MPNRKNKSADLHGHYKSSLLLGGVITLGLLVGLFRADIRPAEPEKSFIPDVEPIAMQEVVNTIQRDKPPPPPRPPAPVEVPDTEVLEEDEFNLDPIDLVDVALPAGPPPAPPTAAALPEDDEVVDFVRVEEMPELIGGMKGLQRAVRYPEVAKKAGVEGRVFIQFVVDETGRVVDPVILKGIGAGCDEEALRAVQQARFEPGKQRNRPVRVRMTLPINFRLK